MEYIYQGAEIECSVSDIISRNIIPGSIISIPNIGICRKYTCKRNSEAFIIKELYPKEAKISDGSHLELNDSLRSENLTIFINCSKTIDKEKCPYSGRHNVQYMPTKYFTHAIITLQFTNIPKVQDIKQIKANPIKKIAF